jgi:hypothetical protein
MLDQRVVSGILRNDMEASRWILDRKLTHVVRDMKIQGVSSRRLEHHVFCIVAHFLKWNRKRHRDSYLSGSKKHFHPEKTAAQQCEIGRLHAFVID